MSKHVTAFEYPPHKSFRSYLIRYLVPLVVLLVALYAVGCFSKGFDRDEWQTMVAAASVADGATLYTDVWDNHGPLLAMVLGGMIRLLDTRDHMVLMFGGRLLMLGMLITTLWLTGRLARRAWPGSALAAPLAMTVLLCSQTFFGKGFEIRPDVPLMLVWTTALWLLHRGFGRNRQSDFLLAGTVLGIGFAFSLKTLLLGVACGVALTVMMIRRKRLYPAWLIAFGLGVLIAPLTMLIWLRQTGSLPAFLDCYLGQNFDRTAESWLLGLQKAWQAEELFLLALTGAVLYALCHRRKTALPEGIVALLAVSGTLLLLYLRLPTHYEQSLLPILPAAAVVIAWTIGQWLQLTWKTRWQRPLQLVLLLLTAASSFDHAWFRHDSDTDMQTVRARMALLPKDAMLFEGVGLPLFQPRPFIYKAYVNTLCERIRKRQMDMDIVTALDRNNVAYAAWDKRMAKMGDEMHAYLRHNFLPLHDGGLLAAGTILPAPGNGEIRWDVRIAGRYYRDAGSEQNDLLVDGLPMGCFVDLMDGPHTFSWTGSNAVVLSVAPPEQWAPLDAVAAWKNEAFASGPN